MLDETARKAIRAALQGDWDDAIAWNQIVLKIQPDNVDALLRSARANYEKGSQELAKSLLQEALKYDPLHPVGNRLQKFFELEGYVPRETNRTPFQQIFIEEPGKTKIVSLINLADKQTLQSIRCGDPAELLPRGYKISITTINKQYLGRLPHDLSTHLINLISKGNRYNAFIKTISPLEVRIFLKETYRSPEVANRPTFRS